MLVKDELVNLTKSAHTFIFIFVVFDVLFFPYIRALGLSISMILVPIYLFFNCNKIKIDLNVMLAFLLIILAIISYTFGSYYYADGIYIDSKKVSAMEGMLTNTVIIIYMFIYFIFFNLFFSRYKFNISNVLFLYILFCFSLSLVYVLNPHYFFYIRSFWTMSGNVIEFDEFNLMYRYTSTFSDPNNFSVIINAVLAFIFMDQKLGMSKKFLATIMVIVCLVSAMSSTGALLFLIVIVIVILKYVFLDPVSFSSLVIRAMLSLVCLVSLTFFLYFMTGTEVGAVATDRVGSNSIGSRLDIWFDIFSFEKLWSSILIGDGGLVVISENIVRRPHNGHLHLIFSYGMLFYFMFMYLFFSKRKHVSLFKHLFMIPIFVGFTVNVGVYELRFVGMVALLTASLNAFQFRRTSQ
jgi:hypothetical protein